MTKMEVVIELRSVQDASFSLPFVVNFCKMGFLGDDLSKIKPFDFPLIAFKFRSPEEFKFSKQYFSTKETTYHLV